MKKKIFRERYTENKDVIVEIAPKGKIIKISAIKKPVKNYKKKSDE